MTSPSGNYRHLTLTTCSSDQLWQPPLVINSSSNLSGQPQQRPALAINYNDHLQCPTPTTTTYYQRPTPPVNSSYHLQQSLHQPTLAKITLGNQLQQPSHITLTTTSSGQLWQIPLTTNFVNHLKKLCESSPTTNSNNKPN